MKYFLIMFVLPLVLVAQNRIDPPSVLTDTTDNYSIIQQKQEEFILGWNWGTPGRKLDNALNINFYHGYPVEGSISDDEYADSIMVVQNDGAIIGGRSDSSSILNTESLYLEPTIEVVTPDDPQEFVPTLRNVNGAVFGFQYKNDDIRYINDPLHPDFGRIFLYKDSVASLPLVVLDSIWHNDILRFYNYTAMLNKNKLNGKEIYISINLKSLEPITNANPNDVILTIKLPYKVWSDKVNGGKGGYVDSNFVKFRNLPKVSGNTSYLFLL